MDERLAAAICLRDSWPAPEAVPLDGWLMRAGKGGYGRANSVWTGRFSGELAAAIAGAEAFYRSRGLPPRFQVLDIAMPANLDAELVRRGYRRAGDCSDMVKDVAGAAMPVDMSFSSEILADWLTSYLSGQTPAHRWEIPLILSRLPSVRAFLLCRRAGRPAGVALVVKVGDDVAVDSVFTLPAFRRSGVARSLLQAADAWAAEQGARRLVLSVVDKNAPAVALYAGLGFRRLMGYHYLAADA